jgi:outer membrane receptor protein involved in Fe transport
MTQLNSVKALSRRSSLLLAASCLTGLGALIHAGAASAQAATPAPQASSPVTVGEVLVTASRRTESVAKIPFNISAYGSKQLERANITNLMALSQEVPNFVIQDQGGRSESTSIPIIRGLNASQPFFQGARFFQSPVGFYQGNAPITGFLPLQDVDRVEVLRGPQGTLYGAGSLSGAVRVVPAEPKLESFSGFLSASVADVAHSGTPDRDYLGVVNIPLGQNAAFRLVAQNQYEAGFIDQFDIMKRAGNDYVSGVPLLANPNDFVGSPSVYFNQKDVNFAETSSVRGSLLWKPTEKFTLETSFSYAHIHGTGQQLDNPTLQGGPSPIDPRIPLTPTGPYQISKPMLEPFRRSSELATVDMSYDLGFATLSSTVAYGETDSYMAIDNTVGLLGTPYGYYYTGVPAYPRLTVPVATPDSQKSYSEEIRLVSKEGGAFDYIVGAFFQQEKRWLGLLVYDPGVDTWSAAAHGGSTLPMINGGTYVPLLPGTNNASYVQYTNQVFHDYSIYSDLTWHITNRWQVTGGARAFHQTFVDHEANQSSFFEFAVNNLNTISTNKVVFKANTSYKLTDTSQAYFTFSQGYRRGGVNAFPTTGFVLEPEAILFYKEDTTNNFEIGVKGTLEGFYYSADAFYIDWQNPQIDMLTPYNLTGVVVNATAATSKGVEFELSGPIGPRDLGLSISLGAAYARARLSQDFGLPAGNGAGGVVQNAIVGHAGDRLPGAPDFSASLNVTYQHELPGAVNWTTTIGADYRSSTVNELPNPNTPLSTAPGYGLLHGTMAFEKGNWEVDIYGTNLADTRAVQSTTIRSLFSFSSVGNWGNSYAINRPREIGIRLTRRW